MVICHILNIWIDGNDDVYNIIVNIFSNNTNLNVLSLSIVILLKVIK